MCVCACLEGTCQPTFQTAAPLQSPKNKKTKQHFSSPHLKLKDSCIWSLSLHPSSLLLSVLSHSLQTYDLSSLTCTRKILFWFKGIRQTSSFYFGVCAVSVDAQTVWRSIQCSSVKSDAYTQQQDCYWLDNGNVSAELQGKSSRWKPAQCRMDELSADGHLIVAPWKHQIILLNELMHLW